MITPVKELRAALAGVPDEAKLVCQGNVYNEEADDYEAATPSYTTTVGPVFSAWLRETKDPTASEFVLDFEITESE